MVSICGRGSYSCIFHYPSQEEVVKVNNRRQGSFLGLSCLAEYDITCRLNHPHLLKAKRIDQEGNLVFPYYPYTLYSKEVLSLPLTTRKQLLHQLISAIDALHQSGYLHLDIKGDNVLVNRDLTSLVLADFGAALFVGGHKSRTSSQDKIHVSFKPPELFQKNEQGDYIYTRSSDYWSLGILCLEILSGDYLLHLTIDQQKLKHDPSSYFDELFSPPLDDEWKEILKGLLTWQEKERRLPHHQRLLPLESSKEKITMTSKLKQIIRKTAKKWVYQTGNEKLESFILAVDLFCRYLSLPRWNDDDDDLLALSTGDLFLVSYWIALKLIEGVNYDPRILFESGIHAPNRETIDKLQSIELSMIKKLKGRLYYPNLFTHAQTQEELLLLEDYLYGQRESLLRNYKLQPYSAKSHWTLCLFLHRLDSL